MKCYKYLPYVFLALIPMSIGIFALLNNVSGFNSTFQKVIMPMLSMSHVSDVSAKAFRGIHYPVLIYAAYIMVITLEFLVGILASIGFFKLIRHIFKLEKMFLIASIWVESACLLGIFVWGFIFFCVGGDYFLSWQNPDLVSLQSGALMYVTLLAIVYFIFRLGPKSLNAN